MPPKKDALPSQEQKVVNAVFSELPGLIERVASAPNLGGFASALARYLAEAIIDRTKEPVLRKCAVVRTATVIQKFLGTSNLFVEAEGGVVTIFGEQLYNPDATLISFDQPGELPCRPLSAPMRNAIAILITILEALPGDIDPHGVVSGYNALVEMTEYSNKRFTIQMTAPHESDLPTIAEYRVTFGATSEEFGLFMRVERLTTGRSEIILNTYLNLESGELTPISIGDARARGATMSLSALSSHPTSAAASSMPASPRRPSAQYSVATAPPLATTAMPPGLPVPCQTPPLSRRCSVASGASSPSRLFYSPGAMLPLPSSASASLPQTFSTQHTLPMPMQAASAAAYSGQASPRRVSHSLTAAAPLSQPVASISQPLSVPSSPSAQRHAVPQFVGTSVPGSPTARVTAVSAHASAPRTPSTPQPILSRSASSATAPASALSSSSSETVAPTLAGTTTSTQPQLTSKAAPALKVDAEEKAIRDLEMIRSALRDDRGNAQQFRDKADEAARAAAAATASASELRKARDEAIAREHETEAEASAASESASAASTQLVKACEVERRTKDALTAAQCNAATARAAVETAQRLADAAMRELAERKAAQASIKEIEDRAARESQSAKDVQTQAEKDAALAAELAATRKTEAETARASALEATGAAELSVREAEVATLRAMDAAVPGIIIEKIAAEEEVEREIETITLVEQREKAEAIARFEARLQEERRQAEILADKVRRRAEAAAAVEKVKAARAEREAAAVARAAAAEAEKKAEEEASKAEEEAEALANAALSAVGLPTASEAATNAQGQPLAGGSGGAASSSSAAALSADGFDGAEEVSDQDVGGPSASLDAAVGQGSGADGSTGGVVNNISLGFCFTRITNPFYRDSRAGEAFNLARSMADGGAFLRLLHDIVADVKVAQDIVDEFDRLGVEQTLRAMQHHATLRTYTVTPPPSADAAAGDKALVVYSDSRDGSTITTKLVEQSKVGAAVVESAPSTLYLDTMIGRFNLFVDLVNQGREDVGALMGRAEDLLHEVLDRSYDTIKEVLAQRLLCIMDTLNSGPSVPFIPGWGGGPDDDPSHGGGSGGGGASADAVGLVGGTGNSTHHAYGVEDTDTL